MGRGFPAGHRGAGRIGSALDLRHHGVGSAPSLASPPLSSWWGLPIPGPWTPQRVAQGHTHTVSSERCPPRCSLGGAGPGAGGQRGDHGELPAGGTAGVGGCHRRQPTSQAPGEALAQPLAFSPPSSPTCMADTGGQSVPQRLPDIPPPPEPGLCPPWMMGAPRPGSRGAGVSHVSCDRVGGEDAGLVPGLGHPPGRASRCEGAQEPGPGSGWRGG